MFSINSPLPLITTLFKVLSFFYLILRNFTININIFRLFLINKFLLFLIFIIKLKFHIAVINSYQFILYIY